MDKFCLNHPKKKALSFCHNCGDSYCSDCLNEGKEFYYCNKKECKEKFIQENPVEKIIDYYDYPHSDIYSRLIASVIDWFVLGIICTIIVLVFDIKLSEEDVVLDAVIFVLVRHPLFYLITLLYYTFMESSRKQATLGKIAQNIIVTDINGERISISKAFIRNISKIISAIPLLFGFIMAEFTKNKQALHDLIARTLVIKLDKNTLPSEITCEECKENISLNIKERITKEYICPSCNKSVSIAS
jgi:uncharacterized RDD family membrane protein YckC